MTRKNRADRVLHLRMTWHGNRLDERQLSSGKKGSFKVGSGSSVDFTMGDALLDGHVFEAARCDDSGFSVFFRPNMKGALRRAGQKKEESLSHLLDSGVASEEADDVWGLSLSVGDVYRVDLGGILLEATVHRAPNLVHVPFLETVDFRLLNVALTLFFLAGLFVLTAIHAEIAEEGLAEQGSSASLRLTRLLVEQRRIQPRNQISGNGHQQDVGKPGTPQNREKKASRSQKTLERPLAGSASGNNQEIMKQLWMGKEGLASSVFDRKSLLRGSTQEAWSGVVDVTGPGSGTKGLGLRGIAGGGGGQGKTIGIGDIGIPGRSGGRPDYGNSVGILGGKKGVNIGVEGSEAVVTSGYDKEWVRQVIKRNSGQIRFCYESQLIRYPNLNGKVALKFVISPEGKVTSATVAQSTVGNSELESCVSSRLRTWSFPAPNAGGVVVVTYPFIFKQSGE